MKMSQTFCDSHSQNSHQESPLTFHLQHRHTRGVHTGDTWSHDCTVTLDTCLITGHSCVGAGVMRV